MTNKTPKDIEEIYNDILAAFGAEPIDKEAVIETLTSLTQHHQAEVEKAVEAERERIRVFVANNYRIDYVKPAIDLEVIMKELETLPKPNITSDKTNGL